MHGDATGLVGLALGGGGARGLCHIGVWRVLEEIGLQPDVIAGTSMGGLVGAMIAAGHDADDLQRIARGVEWRHLIDWRLSGRLLSTRGFTSWLRDLVPETFEELEVPLVLTATDVVDGQLRYLSSGDLLTAIRATTAYPGAIQPVPVGDAILVDGGILNQIPTDAALFMGARRIVAVDATVLEPLVLPDASEKVRARRTLGGALREAMRAIDVMQSQLTVVRASLYRPDVLIDPRIDGVDITDFRKAEQAIRAGEEAAREQVDRLRELVTPSR